MKEEMEGTIKIHVEKLLEGYYLATSEDVQGGPVAPGHTIMKTLEIARNIAKKFFVSQNKGEIKLQVLDDEFDYPLVIGI